MSNELLLRNVSRTKSARQVRLGVVDLERGTLCGMSKVVTDENKIEELLTRRIENVFPSKEEATTRLKSGEPLKVYLGIDPTGPQIHLGHTIPLLFLKQLSELGHKPSLLIGDFTARIGDPTDKEAARTALSEEQVKENMRNYLEQVHKVLPKGLFEVEYNSKWLSKMVLEDFMKLASKMTLKQLEQRQMFKTRIEKDEPIHINELLYPLMQGYDSVAMEVDGEVGGNDQTFNMLVGRDLEKAMLGKDKLVFATRLLVDAKSGKKMSKTEGGFIAINDEPKDIFEKVQNTIPDEMIKAVFELCTEVRLDQIDWNKNPIELKEDLAYELVKMYHGEKEAEKAKQDWRKEDEFAGAGLRLVEFVSKATEVSMSMAKDLLTQNAVEINGEVITDWNYEVQKGDIIKIGKKRPIKAI